MDGVVVNRPVLAVVGEENAVAVGAGSVDGAVGKGVVGAVLGIDALAGGGGGVEGVLAE